MSSASDLAELSSVRSQLEELAKRVETIAIRYRETPDSAVAVDLFETERALVSAGRVLDRALTALAELTS
jgi:hypothetical protein